MILIMMFIFFLLLDYKFTTESGPNSLSRVWI